MGHLKGPFLGPEMNPSMQSLQGDIPSSCPNREGYRPVPACNGLWLHHGTISHALSLPQDPQGGRQISDHSILHHGRTVHLKTPHDPVKAPGWSRRIEDVLTAQSSATTPSSQKVLSPHFPLFLYPPYDRAGNVLKLAF